MKILHIWDQAGVACILAKHHRRRGHEVRIHKRAGYDPFGISQFYNEPLLHMDGKAFLKYAIKEAAGYDVVHVHTLYKIIPDLRKKYRDKKLVLHYHGSEARSRQGDPLKAEAESRADVVLGSTDDLKDFVDDIVGVPNPVDTEHFAPGSSLNGKAFMIRTPRGNTQWVLDYLKSNNIDLQVEVVNREASPIPYAQVPTFLRQYGTCVDIKYIDGILLHAMSKTGLESLACGLSVLDHELKYVEGLPEKHKPEIAASKMLGIYNSVA
jgi:glycosyltransferase involved in cell wall biosynthesis